MEYQSKKSVETPPEGYWSCWFTRGHHQKSRKFGTGDDHKAVGLRPCHLADIETKALPMFAESFILVQ